MSVMPQKHAMIYQVGFSLLLFLSLIVFISTFFYLLGVPVLSVTVVLSMIGTMAFLVVSTSMSRQEKLLVACVVLLVILVCALCSTYVYDLSFDGNTYHKTTIGMLANGWNPVYQSFEDAALKSNLIPAFNWPIWYDHYPKASWIIGAAFYALSGNIETGKCMNGIMMIAVFCLLLGTLRKYQLLPGWKGYLFAFLAVLNPITIAQMQSYYIDGTMQMLIYATILSLLEISFCKEKHPPVQCWIVIFCAVNLALNMKYSGLVFLALYCGAFYLYWVVRDCQAHNKLLGIQTRKISLFYMVSVGCALCFTGATSYMRNLFQHHNLLYTMIGQDKIEIISTMLPDAYAHKPNIVQFLLSLFSETSNISAGSGLTPQLKWPFTITIDQIKMGAYFDSRISGWGLLFSGIFLLSLLLLIPLLIRLYRQRKEQPGVFAVAVLLLAITLGQAFVIPGLAMARYYGHLFLLPQIVLGLLLNNWNNRPLRRWRKIFVSVLAALLILNFSNYAFYDLTRVNLSQDMRVELLSLHTLSKEAPIYVSLLGGNYMQGYLFNLNDADVNYTVIPQMDDGATIFNWQIGYKTK